MIDLPATRDRQRDELAIAVRPDRVEPAPVLATEEVSFWYGDNQVLSDISLTIPQNQVTSIIGPSGCGKSTYLRLFNRLNEMVRNTSVKGRVLYRGRDVFGRDVDPVEVRRRIGMVFQKPNPFPKSIYQNVAFGPKVNGFKGDMDDLVERSLRQAALWNEVKDDLKKSALTLSGGQQQRLCIARAIAVEPEVILMDEPCSALDPIATTKIEDLIRELRERFTIVIVTHNMQQAARISDLTAFFLNDNNGAGELVELDETQKIFTNPSDERTEAYITGRFG